MPTSPSDQTALLIMDVQPSTVERYAQNSDLLPRLATTIAAARTATIPVIFVRVKFRQGYPEISPRNKMFGGIKQRVVSFQGAALAMEVHPDIAPLPSDSVVTKLRVSAFAGSDLEVLLRAQDIRHLVLCGIATSGVVLSTLREAADKDYGLTVLSDCCVDNDEEVQRVLLTKVFPHQAEVITSEQWCEAIENVMAK
jgi:nicotinamidase-related amidase